jgi:hypothetical protein
MHRFVSLSALLVICAAPATAQVCGGYSSFANGMFQVGGGMSFESEARAYEATFSAGSPKGIFGGASIGRIDIKDASEGATNFSTGVGYAFPVKSRAQICPIVGYRHARMDDIDTGFGSTLRIRSNAYQLGGAMGTVLSFSPTIDFSPFISAAYVHEKLTLREVGVGSVSASDDYGTIGGGVGFVFKKALTVQPSVMIPFGSDENDPVFKLGFSISFGRRAQ